MKKLLFSVISILLAFSLCACTGKGDSDDTAESETDIESDSGDSVKLADTNAILAAYRDARSDSGVMYSIDLDVFSMATEFSIYSDNITYIRDNDGNIYVESSENIQFSVGNTYRTQGNDVSISSLPLYEEVTLSDDERTAHTEALRKAHHDLKTDATELFDDIIAVDNENGTYTILCHSEEDDVIAAFEDGIRANLVSVFDEDYDYDFGSVDYQLMVDNDGKLLAFIVAASFELLTGKEAAEGSLENYYSYLFVAAVSEYTESVTISDAHQH